MSQGSGRGSGSRARPSGAKKAQDADPGAVLSHSDSDAAFAQRRQAEAGSRQPVDALVRGGVQQKKRSVVISDGAADHQNEGGKPAGEDGRLLTELGVSWEAKAQADAALAG